MGVFVLAALSWTPEARCQTEQELRDWLAAEQAAVASWNGPGESTIFRVREYTYSFFSRAEAERLREEVRGRPDHPQRFRIEQHDKFQREGPRVHETALLGVSKVGLRAFRDDPAGEERYRDTMISPEEGWSLTPDRLVLTKGSASRDHEHRVDADVSVVIGDVRSVLFGPGVTLHNPNTRVEEIVIDADALRWEAVAAAPGSAVWRLRGRWLAADGRGVVDEAVCLHDAANPEWERTVIRAEGWRYDEDAGRPVAGDVTTLLADGTMMQRIEFVGAEASPVSIKEGMRPPRVDSTDAFRGPITVARVLDYSGREYTATTVTPAGTESVTLGSDKGSGSLLRALRAAGWIALAGAVVALAWLRVRRSG